LLVAAGTLLVGLGIVGIFVPVLPATPFLLLAAVCYARSSQRLYNWLLTNRWCGAYIRNYREGKGISLKLKAVTLSLLWLTIGASAILAVELWWVRLILLAIAIGVTTHIMRLRTLRD
jgi:hypothetical protein